MSVIKKGDHIQATADYEGLPVGAEVVFKNNSILVINMSVDSSENRAGTSVEKVSRTNGTITVDITGKTEGSFVIDDDIIFS